MGTPNAISRAALVTGAGKRIGRGIALGLARAGWDIAVHFGQSTADAHETVRQVQALGRRAQAFGADLASESQTRSMFEAAATAFPDLSCLVNNASRFEPDTPATISFAALDGHLRPNLAAPVVLAQLLHARLAPAHPDPAPPATPGVVINLLDQKLDNPNPDFFSYTLTKAGLLAANHIMAMAFAPDPDLFIRTGGEMRISNFLLWQTAYSELFFTECLWPDFGLAEMDAAFAAYARRDRRFGTLRSSSSSAEGYRLPR